MTQGFHASDDAETKATGTHGHTTRTIWKFVVGDTLTAELADPRALAVGCDPASGWPAVWVEHTPDARATHRLEWRIVGTGWTGDLPGEYVGTAICGSFVWHVYQRGVL